MKIAAEEGFDGFRFFDLLFFPKFNEMWRGVGKRRRNDSPQCGALQASGGVSVGIQPEAATPAIVVTRS